MSTYLSRVLGACCFVSSVGDRVSIATRLCRRCERLYDSAAAAVVLSEDRRRAHGRARCTYGALLVLWTAACCDNSFQSNTYLVVLRARCVGITFGLVSFARARLSGSMALSVWVGYCLVSEGGALAAPFLNFL